MALVECIYLILQQILNVPMRKQLKTPIPSPKQAAALVDHKINFMYQQHLKRALASNQYLSLPSNQALLERILAPISGTTKSQQAQKLLNQSLLQSQRCCRY
jgi:hypothetical protein